ncbi:MAG: zinc-dependent alcohol dehydrogenase [Propionibacteriaceae bacterium]
MTVENVRRVVVEGIDTIRIERRPAPEAGAGQVLVEPILVGICGSDLHAAHGRHPFIPLPFEPGHEVIGRIVAVGAGVDPGRVGNRVFVDPGGHCGKCEQCRDGRSNICAELDVFGCLSSGGLTDVFAYPAEGTVDLADDLPDEMAVLTEPLSTPVHAVRRAGDLTGKRVVITGGGPIGLFLLTAARRAGAATVVVQDLLPSKRDRAVRLGATAGIDPRSDTAVDDTVEALGGQAQVVFDAVANEATVRTAIRSLLVRGGRLMVVGVPAGPLPVDLELVQDNEIEIIGNLMFVREDIRTALEILGSQPFPAEELISHVFDLEDAAEAFRASDDPGNVKILIRVGQGGQTT